MSGPIEMADTAAGVQRTLRDNSALAADQAEDQSDHLFNSFPTHRLSPFSVGCLIINKTIGSGIFTQPYNVVSGVGNSAFALVLWVLAGVISLCTASCWAELALSIPRIVPDDGSEPIATPKSGGDKNYLEYIFKLPDLLITCVYGITFLIFGNLAGNAIQFGIFMQNAINPEGGQVERRDVVAWAVAVLIICAMINITTRKGAILMSNLFAMLKLSLLVVMIFLGIGWGTAHGNGCTSIEWRSKGEGGGFNNAIQALTFAMYPASGFEQPFYILAEVKQPNRLFVPTVMTVMTLILVLHPLINTSYFCVNPYEGPQAPTSNGARATSTNAAINYFSTISAGGSRFAVVRGTSVLLGLSVFSNLLAVVYTAPRVKQEISKEGILPWSLFFAASKGSLLSRLSSNPNMSNREQVPMAATALHLAFEIILVLCVGLTMEPAEAYNTLSYLYTYVITGILGLLTVAGLLYLKVDAWISPRRRGRHWSRKSKWSLPFVDWLSCIIPVLALGVILIGAFVKPSKQEPGGQQWWLKPLVGWCGLSLGVFWWLGMELRQFWGKYRIRRVRTTYVEPVDSDHELVQTAEMIVVEKKFRTRR